MRKGIHACMAELRKRRAKEDLPPALEPIVARRVGLISLCWHPCGFSLTNIMTLSLSLVAADAPREG
jgi:hypothetical protein